MLKLPAQFIINQVDDFYHQCKQLMETGDDVLLDISQVEKADTASLQLLCVIQNSLNETGHHIVWQGESPPLSNTAKTIGVNDYLQL